MEMEFFITVFIHPEITAIGEMDFLGIPCHDRQNV